MALKKMIMSFTVLVLTTTVGVTSDIEAMSQKELLEHHKKTVANSQKEIYTLNSTIERKNNELEEIYKSAEIFFALPENDLQQKLIDSFSMLQPDTQTWWGTLTGLFGTHDVIQQVEATTKDMMMQRIAKKVGKVVRPYAQTAYYQSAMDYYVALQLSGIIGSLPELYNMNPEINFENSVHKKVFDVLLNYANENGINFSSLQNIDQSYYTNLFTQTIVDLNEKGFEVVEKELFDSVSSPIAPPPPPPPALLTLTHNKKTIPAAKKQADTELKTDSRKSQALLEELSQRLQARVSQTQTNIEQKIKQHHTKMVAEPTPLPATVLRKRKSHLEETLSEQRPESPLSFESFIQKARCGGLCPSGDDFGVFSDALWSDEE